jgi:DNA-binding GntR family transcriptional regulator
MNERDVTIRRPMTTTSDPARKTRDEAVYADIYDAILDHRLPPGTKLTEDSLGEVFGVSRTVIRKALFRLGHEGIVRIRPNRGAAVASPSTEEARDVFATRRVLEDAVVGEVTGVLGEAELDALRALAREEREAFERGDRRSWIRLSGDFHLGLAELAGNAVVFDFLKELVSRTSLIIALYDAAGQSACGFDEHMALIDAIAAGDRKSARKLMAAHLSACEDKLNLEGADETVDLSDVFARAEERGRRRRAADA